METGAQSSVIGLKQAKAYCHHTGIELEFLKSDRSFRFANMTSKSLGKPPIRVPVPNLAFIEQLVDVVDADIPLLLGLDVLDEEGIYMNNVTNKLVHQQDGWSMNLTRKFGHMFLL